MKPQIVVAAAIAREGRYLLALRPEGKRHGGMWEFPGGKLDPGESLTDGIRRELLEELTMGVNRIGATRLIVNDPGSSFEIHFVEAEAVGTPRALEHSDLRWCRPEEMKALRLAPADEQFAELLIREASSPH